jgi:hypothetical protein
MIAEKQLIIILIHFCEGLTHVIGIAVCRDKMQLRDIKWPPQALISSGRLRSKRSMDVRMFQMF